MGIGLAYPERSIPIGNPSPKFPQFLFEIVSHLLPVNFLWQEMACYVTLQLNLNCDKSRYSTNITDHYFEACACFLFDGNHPYQLQSISWLCSVMTNGIIQYLFHTNHQLHEVQVAYHICFYELYKSRGLSNGPICIQVSQKCSNQKKSNDKISSQTEFTMSRRLAAHNNTKSGKL